MVCVDKRVVGGGSVRVHACEYLQGFADVSECRSQRGDLQIHGCLETQKSA